MSTRSRGGCVDCKRSKVKCDEARPSCGTCARRRLVCHGYQNTKEKQSQHKPRRSPSPHSNPRRVRRRRASNVSASSPVERNTSPIAGSVSPNERNSVTDHDNDGTTSSQLVTSKSNSTSTYRDLPSPAALMRLSEIPPGMIRPEDESTIEIYFNRHPTELVIGREFINEMNANVLMVLQHNPKAIGDCLFVVGSLYVAADEGNSIIPILDRRARIFASLRSMSELECDLEQMVVMLLGLCAMELIDTKTPTGEIQIPALLQNTAILINHHINCGKKVTSLAKYFIRALARQDMITSLTHFRRPVISTTVWLDEECRRTADRFMGYTTTLMPLLTELSVLAEDVRGSVPMSYILDVPGGTNLFPSSQGSSLTQRAAHLSARITAWEPTLTQGVSFRSSRKFLSQAFSYRSAALLYLHRLFHPPNSSLDADEVAVEMAYKVLVYTSNQYPEDLRMSLWPVFIAACEFTSEDDRAVALDAFDAICTHRRTATSLRTRQFCIERVWKARDSGLSWNWMDLVAQYPGECLPI